MNDKTISDAGVSDAPQADASPYRDGGIYIEVVSAGQGPPIWFSDAEAVACTRVYSALLTLVPIIGAVKSLYEAISGTDMLTDEEKAAWERALDLTAAFTSVVGGLAKVSGVVVDSRKVIKVSDDLVDALNNLQEFGQAGYIAAGSVEHFKKVGPAFLSKVIGLSATAKDSISMLEALVDFTASNDMVPDTTDDANVTGDIFLPDYDEPASDGDYTSEASDTSSSSEEGSDSDEAESSEGNNICLPDDEPASDEAKGSESNNICLPDDDEPASDEAEGSEDKNICLPDDEPASDEAEGSGGNNICLPDDEPASDEAEGSEDKNICLPDDEPASDEAKGSESNNICLPNNDEPASGGDYTSEASDTSSSSEEGSDSDEAEGSEGNNICLPDDDELASDGDYTSEASNSSQEGSSPNAESVQEATHEVECEPAEAGP